jgi:hypothetical protein
MSLLFWIIAAGDAVLFAVMLFSYLQGGSDSGGREMGIFFFVLVPSVILALSVLLHIYSRAPFWRMLALFIVAGPGLLFLGTQVRNVYIDHLVEQRASGRGYFDSEPLNQLGAAVVGCDTDKLQKLGHRIDLNIRGREGITLLGLAVERAIEQPECTQGSRLAVVQKLLALGANADSGLDNALRMKDSAILAELLKAGANPNQLSSSDQPIIFRWRSVTPPESFRLMIEHGLDLNATEYGTPLAVDLTIYRRWDLLAIAIEHGADWRRPRKDGRNVAAEIATQITELEKEGTAIPADLTRVQTLVAAKAAADAALM